MRTSNLTTDLTTPPRRSRFGYSPQWWQEPSYAPIESHRYWSSTRHPSLCLLYVVPLLVVYEGGIRTFGGENADGLRAGIDTWVHHGFGLLGLTNPWIPPLLLLIGLGLWLRADRENAVWRLEPLAGMMLESVSLAVGLIGISKLVDLGLHHLDPAQVQLQLSESVPTSHLMATHYLSFLGAGIYEESVFRLALIPLFFACGRMLLIPGFLASTLAITASSLLFSVAHHVGVPGETFTWYAFIFRWLAGVYFSWVFVARGFGIAVGAHVAYDCLVGWLALSG